MLEYLPDEHFTTELATFNLEFRLDPVPFGGNCLRQLEIQLSNYLAQARVSGGPSRMSGGFDRDFANAEESLTWVLTI